MLNLAQVLTALDPEDWMVALDLQDPYYYTSILPAHQCYLQFVVERSIFSSHHCHSGAHESDGGGGSPTSEVRCASLPLPSRLAVEGGLTPGSCQ